MIIFPLNDVYMIEYFTYLSKLGHLFLGASMADWIIDQPIKKVLVKKYKVLFLL